MQKESKDKMMKAQETKAPEGGTERQYHFSGSGVYEPLTITAKSREEAEEKWRKARKKVEPINKPINSESK